MTFLFTWKPGKFWWLKMWGWFNKKGNEPLIISIKTETLNQIHKLVVINFIAPSYLLWHVDDTAQTLSFFHEIESFVDILEQKIMSDELVNHDFLCCVHAYHVNEWSVEDEVLKKWWLNTIPPWRISTFPYSYLLCIHVY